METGAGSELCESEILESITQEPPHPPPQPPPGKLRKTAFKFFSSRRSICVLPSFFGGLGKGQGRASSKTGVTKSRTHDGVSRGCWDDGVRGNGDVAAGDFEFRTHRDCGGGSDSHRGTETLKSQFLPWQRRGLRGLFSSIRRHKRNKNVEAEKISSMEMLPSACNVPVSQAAVGHHRSEDDGRLGSVLEPVVPDSANGKESIKPVAAECMKADVLVPESRGRRGDGDPEEDDEEEEVVGQKRSSGVAAAVEEGEIISMCIPGTYRQPLGADSELVRLTEQNLEGADSDPPVASSSSDHASLVFGDVASLKSFDSLTGCGDIIADQDDDSVAESSVSGERGSRNAGKRSSCFVTYQGGGEEMATPDEVDGDYLQGLWEAEAANEACYVPSPQPDTLAITPDQPISSLHTLTTPTTTSSSEGGGGIGSNTNSSSPLGVLETVLTPQSDHQESVPNSDEGYYDSTTPGADEDARERVVPRHERLPRDSYSGDALYELFEPDDRLLSPSMPDDDDSGDPCDFLGVPLPGSTEGKGGSPVYALKTGAMDTCAMETEEDRLSKIQQALLCCELQSLRATGKEPLLFGRGPYYPDSDLPLTSCMAGKKQLEEPVNPRGTRISPVHHALEDAPLSPDGESGPQMQDNATYSQVPSPLQESEAYRQHDQGSLHGPSLPSGHSQEELTVCFSQALVDFTKNTRVFCNSTESLDDSESSSPFGQNLQALPTIVTFDVVDMENEGEFEQQTELGVEGVDEELASPFEPFEPFEDESCYLQKDAFAECDERLFDAYEQSLLLGNTWGITSLPRHLSSGRASRPTPPPLALNRRSRSLDTDSLELRTNEASTLGGAQHEAARMAGSLHRKKKSGHVSPTPNPSANLQRPAAARDSRKHVPQEQLVLASNSASLCQKQPSMCPPMPDTHSASKPALQAAIRPSDLPLQLPPSFRGRSPAGASTGGNGVFRGASQSSGESLEVFYHCGLAEPGHLQGKVRPVGVTQGVPHPCPSSVGPPNPWALDKERELSSKSIKAVEVGYGPAQTKRST